MPEFWVASGHHFARRNAAGRLLVTDELILAWLARPEVLPPADACATERALHKRLMDKPRAKVSDMELAAIKDADARENWQFLLRLRDTLLEAGTIEEGYQAILHKQMVLPFVFTAQLLQLILRNALDGCDDPQVLRAAECFFRPQRAHVKEDKLLLADDELVELFEQEMHSSPLTAMFSGGVDSLDVLGGGNEWTYWSRSDAHTTVLNFGGDPKARAGMATAIEAFLRHMLALEVTVTPQSVADQVDLRWFVGLDPVGTAIGNALWNGATPKDTLVGLFRMDLPSDPRVRADMRGQPVWLLLGLGPDRILRMKPQNLLLGLPLMEPALN